MKKVIFTTMAFVTLSMVSKAQTTAMQISGQDCNGVSHDLFADLDAGKAVILHFFMPNCSSCPPPAQQIQAMANNILATHPGMITAYAMPFNNTTTCAYTSGWVSTNGLSLYAPYDSGAVQVAHYGGFGMPTVVVLGGIDHHVMFSTLSFTNSDTTIMRDGILAMLNGTGISKDESAMASFSVFPNPASDFVTVNLKLTEPSKVLIDVLDMNGKRIFELLNENQNGNLNKQFNTTGIPNGNYLIRLTVNGKSKTQQINITH